MAKLDEESGKVASVSTHADSEKRVAILLSGCCAAEETCALHKTGHNVPKCTTKLVTKWLMDKK